MYRRAAPRLTLVLGGAVFLSGALTLIGWIADVPTLKDWSGSGITMKANAAIAAMAAGSALALLATGKHRVVAWAVGLVTFLIGGLTLCEHVSGLNLGIDTLFFHEPVGARATVAPGRMGPPASFACTAVGLAILLAGSERIWMRRVAVIVGIAVTTMAALSLGGYLFGANPLYGVARYTGISLQMSILVASMGIALMAALPDRQPMRTLLANTGAGLLSRRALPFIVFLPFAMGWLRTAGEGLHLYDPGTGRALLIVLLVAMFCGLLAWAAAIIDARERSLKASEESFSKAFLASPDALALTRVSDGLVYQVNDSYLRMLGRAREEVLGRTTPELDLYVDPSVRELIVQKLTNGERLRDYEIDLRNQAGEVIHTLCSVEPIEIGDTPHMLSIIRDITAAKRTRQTLIESEERLRIVNEELERRVAERTAELLEANEQLNGFTYSVAHDLRQSIRGIVINAQLVRSEYTERLDADGQASLERLAEAGKKMSELVDDLLKYARISKHEPRREAIDLTTLARLSAHETLERYPSATVNVEDGLRAEGDAGLVKMVLENLIDNACKYVATGVAPRIDVGKDGDWFFVRDNGIGFESQYAERIFEPFERLQAGNLYPGTGIGLANARRVVEKHGGAIWAESAPGCGTTIRFHLGSVGGECSGAADGEAQLQS